MATTAPTTKYEQHPLAQQYAPGNMPEEEFKALCADIAKRGQLLPVTIYEGKILSGWHRYRAVVLAGMPLKSVTYEGDDPHGLVIALEHLRRKLGAIQRAVAGARLVIEHGLTQDAAALQVAVSKVHVNLVVQAINSKNARIIKSLENPNLTRNQLHEDMVDVGIIRPSQQQQTAAAVAAAAPPLGGDAFDHFARTVTGDAADIFGDDGMAPTGDAADDFMQGDDGLDGLLDEPPSANGKVIKFEGRKGEAGDGPGAVVGVRPTHPERRPKETAASMLAERFRGLTEADQISVLQIIWPIARKLLKPAGLSTEVPPKVESVATGKGRTKKVAEVADAAIATAKAAASA